MAGPRKTERSETGPPTRLAEGPPPPEAATLPLMAVMEIQRTLGSLTKSVESLTESQKTMQADLSAVSQKVSNAQTAVYVIGVGVMAAIALLGWIIDKAVEVLPTLLPPK